MTQGIVLFREPKMGSGIESPFPVYRFHNEKNEAPCRKCHDMNPPEQGVQGFAAATQFCLGCHKELTGMRVVHGPIPIGGCAPCHQFSSRPNRYEVLAQGQELCFKCHEEKRKDLIRSFLHGPMSAGLCTICHNPHGSSEKYQLRRYVGRSLRDVPRGDEIGLLQEGRPQTGERRRLHRLPRLPLLAAQRQFREDAGERPVPFVPHRRQPVLPYPPVRRSAEAGATDQARQGGEPPCALTCHEPHAGDEPKLLVKGGCSICHD